MGKKKEGPKNGHRSWAEIIKAILRKPWAKEGLCAPKILEEAVKDYGKKKNERSGAYLQHALNQLEGRGKIKPLKKEKTEWETEGECSSSCIWLWMSKKKVTKKVTKKK